MSISDLLSVRPKLRSLAVCTVLFSGTVLLFSRALGYDFSNYDDPRYITNNPFVQAGFTGQSIGWAFTLHTDYWHPLSWLSHMLDWHLYRDNAAGHHLTSIVWHAVNAVLTFLVLRRLTGAFWTSACSAAVFAWHPLRVESVAWITERKDVLSGFFFLLTLWAYADYAERRRKQVGAGKYYLLTLGLFAAGLMSKPMLVTLPLVLLILDFWPLQRGPTDSASTAVCNNPVRTCLLKHPMLKLLYEKIPFFALSIAASVVTVKTQQITGSFTLELPFDARVGNAVVSVVRYLGKFFWPFNLTPFYPHPGYWPWFGLAGATCLVSALTALAWHQRKTRPWIMTGWLLFLTMLLPALGLIQAGFQAMADRYTYLPILGWQLALLWTLREIAIRPSFRWAAGALGGIVLVGCVARTWSQQATWRDPVSLLEHALTVTNQNDTAEALLGYTLLGFHQIDEANLHSERALKINPRNDSALFTRACVRMTRGRTDEAEADFRAVLQLKPNSPDADYLLGRLLLSQGHRDEAIGLIKSAVILQPGLLRTNFQNALEEAQGGRFQNAVAYYEVAVTLNPNDADAHFGLGLVLARLGQIDEALLHYETTVRLRPDHVQAHIEIGFAKLSQNQPAEALTHFRAAVKTQPNLGVAYVGLGRAAQQLGYTAEASSSFEHAIACAPNDPAAQTAWAETLMRRGQFVDAASHYEIAVKLQPQNASAHAGLGYALFLSNQHENAIAQWEEALRLEPNFPGLRDRIKQYRQ